MHDRVSNIERIAKKLARAGVGSRRECEKIVVEGRVAVNGEVIFSPALNVSSQDIIRVDQITVTKPDKLRLWRYYKPAGLVVSNRDEKGRRTIFEEMPETLPRIITVGRLDLTSEGLLLLTNCGDTKRKLEHPNSGWLRRYRVRARGHVSENTFTEMRKGLDLDGQLLKPMEVECDYQKGANVWLTVGLREGKYREIRRALQSVNLVVNRLIRISFGPFELGKLKSGEVVEVVSKSQLAKIEF